MGEDWTRPVMPTKAMLELYFKGDWHVISGDRVYTLGSHTPVPWEMTLTATYGILRMKLRMTEGGLFIASLNFEDLDGVLVQSAGGTFTEAINNVVRAYHNTVNSLPALQVDVKDERGAYYRQHLKRRAKS